MNNRREHDLDLNDIQLSPHFTLKELCHSHTALKHNIANMPNSSTVKHSLQDIATLILEPIRLHFDIPFSPSSGYRSPALNKRLGGSPNSQHLKGQAVDIEIPGIANSILYLYIKENLEFDQLIGENLGDTPHAGWIHVSFIQGKNRNQAFHLNSGIKAK